MRNVLVALAIATSSASALAAGPSKKACAAAYEKAQELYKDGKYSSARGELAVCSEASCPDWIKSDCVKMAADIEQNQPTIVIVARDSQGKDVGDARVILDGEMIAERNSGTPVPVDPGEHKVRLVRTDANGTEQASEQSFVARAGERNRDVVVTFQSHAPAPAPPVEQPKERRGSPVPAIIVGSAGLLTLGVSIGIGLAAKSDVDGMRATCGMTHSCAQSDIDSANAKLIVSDILTVAGIVGIAGGVVLFLLRPKMTEPATTGVVVTPARGGATASFSMHF
jgi:hypothetical protein